MYVEAPNPIERFDHQLKTLDIRMVLVIQVNGLNLADWMSYDLIFFNAAMFFNHN